MVLGEISQRSNAVIGVGKIEGCSELHERTHKLDFSSHHDDNHHQCDSFQQLCLLKQSSQKMNSVEHLQQADTFLQDIKGNWDHFITKLTLMKIKFEPGVLWVQSVPFS